MILRIKLLTTLCLLLLVQSAFAEKTNSGAATLYLSPSQEPYFEQTAGPIFHANTLYVLDSKRKQIALFNRSGKLLEQVVLGEPQPETPCDLTILNDVFYITDSTKHQVLAYSKTGKHIFSVGKKGRAQGQFNTPLGISSDNIGFIYVADSKNKRIQILNPEGVFVREIRTISNYKLAGPTDVDVDLQFNIYIADNYQRLFKSTNLGSLIAVIEPNKKNKLRRPFSVTVNALNQIYVSEHKHNNVVVFTGNGDYLGQIDSALDVMFQVNEPGFMAADIEVLYISDRKFPRVIRFTSTFPADIPLFQAREDLVRINLESHIALRLTNFTVGDSERIYYYNESGNTFCYNIKNQQITPLKVSAQVKSPSSISAIYGKAIYLVNAKKTLHRYDFRSKKIELVKLAIPADHLIEQILTNADSLFVWLINNNSGKHLLYRFLLSDQDYDPDILLLPSAPYTRMTVGANGDIYFYSTRNKKMFIVASEFTSYKKISLNKPFLNNTDLNGKYAVALNSIGPGYLLTLDADSHRIHLFNNVGLYLNSFGAYGESERSFRKISMIKSFPDRTGRTMIYDSENERLSIVRVSPPPPPPINIQINSNLTSSTISWAAVEQDTPVTYYIYEKKGITSPWVYIAKTQNTSYTVGGEQLNFDGDVLYGVRAIAATGYKSRLKTTPIDYFARAMRYYNSKNYDLAKENIKVDLKRNAKKIAANMLCADISAAQFDFEEAIKATEKILNMGIESAAIYYRLGTYFLELKRYDIAIKHLIRSTEYPPENPETYIKIAQIYSTIFRHDEAFRYLEKASKMATLPVAAYKLMGETYYFRREFAKAIDPMQRYLEQNPRDKEIYQKLVTSCRIAGKLEDAILYMLLLLDMEASNADLYLQLSNLYMSVENYDEALTQLAVVDALDPGKASTHLSMAICFNMLKQYEQARSEIFEVLKREPNNLQAHYFLGVIYANLESSEALKEFLLVLKADPTFPYIHENIGNYYAKDKNTYDSAKEYYLKAIESGSFQPLIFDKLTNIYLAENDFDKAIDFLTKTIEIKGETIPVLKTLSEIYIKANRHMEAISVFDKMLLKQPKNISLYLAKASSLEKNHKQLSALRTYRELLSIDPQNTRALYVLAKEALFEKNYQQTGELLARLIPDLADLDLPAKHKELSDDYKQELLDLEVRYVRFITLKNTDLNKLTSSLLAHSNNKYTSNKLDISRYLYYPMQFFNMLGTYGIQAREADLEFDPDKEKSKFYQYPTETLERREGDTVDLLILYLSILKSYDIKIKCFSYGSNFVVLVKTQADPLHLDRLGSYAIERFIVDEKKQIWVPIDLAKLNHSFYDAWDSGVSIYNLKFASKSTDQEESAKPLALDSIITNIDVQYNRLLQIKPKQLHTLTSKLDYQKFDQQMESDINRFLQDAEQNKIDKYNALITENPTNLGSYLKLLTLFEESGRIGDAQALLEDACEIFPKNVKMRLKLSSLYNSQKAYSKSSLVLREVLSLKPHDGELNYRLADVYYKLKQHKKAIKRYQQAIIEEKAAAWLPTAHFKIGLAYSKLKEYKNAIFALEKYLELFPAHVFATDARETIKIIQQNIH